MLSKRQKEIYDYVKQYIKKNQYAPSLDEIKEYFKFASVSTAHHHIQSLINKGYINKESNQHRSLDVMEKEPLLEIPLLGTIAAGMPIEAIEIKETVAIPKSKLPTNANLFALKVRGNSMIDENIHDGDIVVAKSQTYAEDGQKIVALINNNEVTLKKFYQEKNRIRLQPANSTMSPIYVKPKNLQIQGLVLDVIETNRSTSIIDMIAAAPNHTKRNYTINRHLNTIQCIDCVEGMKNLPDNSVDLVVTSPPYDQVRNYNGYSFELHSTGKELYRILKDGGVVAMVIQDQTKDFAKSLTSFRTIVDWCDNIGFRLFETVIYRKYGTEGAWWRYRFRVDHEYMPIFFKGPRPAYFEKEGLKIPSKHGGKVLTGSGNRKTDGTTTATITRAINAMKCRGTVWDYLNAGDKDQLKRQHPAVFPDKIPYDFIQCFCPPGGVVLDPFMGCGSTAVAAIKLNRKYIGFDISKEYCELAQKRIQATNTT